MLAVCALQAVLPPCEFKSDNYHKQGLELIITSCTVVQHRDNGDQAFLCETAKFVSSQNQNQFTDLYEIM